MKPRTYTLDGVTRTLPQWSRVLNVSLWSLRRMWFPKLHAKILANHRRGIRALYRRRKELGLCVQTGCGEPNDAANSSYCAACRTALNTRTKRVARAKQKAGAK